LAVLAPVSLALGLPFPLGLACLGQNSSTLPWAWGLNGAFSVVASPMANLIAREWGLNRLLLYAAAMYALVLVSYPAKRRGVRDDGETRELREPQQQHLRSQRISPCRPEKAAEP
jgi:hypothetical protein